MARRLGMEPASYSRLENGRRRCYLDKAIAIASMLHCTTDDLRVIPDEAERLRLWSMREDNADAIKAQAPEENGTVVSNTAPHEDTVENGEVEHDEVDLTVWADDD